jgi:REP element-mobilizing transposase RayT
MTYYERNLPHWHPLGRAIFITWRLAGSLPRALLAELKSSEKPANRKFAVAESVLDAASCGPRWLAESEIAEVVRISILKGALELRAFELFAYVIMPNHVHLLLEPKVPVERITRGIKGASAHLANRIIRQGHGPFWQEESFDHWVRTAAEGEKICRYIENNPVKAGLAKTPSNWPWSSAGKVAQAFLPVSSAGGDEKLP